MGDTKTNEQNNQEEKNKNLDRSLSIVKGFKSLFRKVNKKRIKAVKKSE